MDLTYKGGSGGGNVILPQLDNNLSNKSKRAWYKDKHDNKSSIKGPYHAEYKGNSQDPLSDTNNTSRQALSPSLEDNGVVSQISKVYRDVCEVYCKFGIWDQYSRYSRHSLLLKQTDQAHSSIFVIRGYQTVCTDQGFDSD